MPKASINGLMAAYQSEAVKVLRSTDGDMWQIVNHLITDMEHVQIFSKEEADILRRSFSDALDVLIGRKKAVKALSSCNNGLASLLKDPESADLAVTLVELCQSVIAGVAVNPRRVHGQQIPVIPQLGTVHALAMVSQTQVTGKFAQMLLWGLIGARIGSSAGGGVIGGVIGAAVGMVIGACGDDDSGTTVTTVVNTGGGGGGGVPA